ncbi:MAG TPA: ABC transporter substrate-binding protein [Actinomycetota bacterium]|nr:ABC transporter substrate-binding protein [Actinomycetota bacterium]
MAVLRVSKAESGAALNRVLRRALTELGQEDGRTLRLVEYFEERVERLPDVAAEIVRAQPNAIVALGLPAVRALREATPSIPIVAVTSFPVELGLVPTLARPGGNLSGVTIFTEELNVKRLALLRELMPDARRLAALRDPAAAPAEHLRSLREAAQELRVTFDVIDASQPEDIAPAFRRAREAGFEAVNVLASPMFNGVSGIIATAAAQARLPTICQWREMTEAGCVMSYGPSYLETLRVVAKQLDRVLRGTRIADLPFEQPTKFELVINLKAAKAIGLDIPPMLLLRADEVIE